MKVHKLADMSGGWFVGAFQPTCLSIDQCEVAVKSYRAGDHEPAHVHRIATELTLIISGKVSFNGDVYVAGDIVQLEPGESARFAAVEDSVTVVVKSPSVKSDKYLI